MSIIKEPKTHEEKIQARKELVKHRCSRLYSTMASKHAQIFSLIWSEPAYELNSDGDKVEIAPDITEQEIFTAFGEEAGDLFEMSLGVQSLLNTVDPDYEPMQATHNYTINEDGTVTVGELREEI